MNVQGSNECHYIPPQSSQKCHQKNAGYSTHKRAAIVVVKLGMLLGQRLTPKNIYIMLIITDVVKIDINSTVCKIA